MINEYESRSVVAKALNNYRDETVPAEVLPLAIVKLTVCKQANLRLAAEFSFLAE